MLYFIKQEVYVYILKFCFSDDASDDIEMTFVRSKPQRIEALCRITKFTKNELKLIYQGFKQVNTYIRDVN